MTCNYHDDAFAIDGNGVLAGAHGIVESYGASARRSGKAAPVPVALTERGDTVRATYRVGTGERRITVEGVDSFRVEAGRIRSQTRSTAPDPTPPGMHPSRTDRNRAARRPACVPAFDRRVPGRRFVQLNCFTDLE